ncbi:hypothetical protein [Roseicyclus marinus]|uniref:hypothetical protein n=1 Tax=Roseicyclus marinus TaxID=2161673 RepID=UPI00240F168C|nr:hypothetical protein [Roseicyclus marinus]MDG3039786.1 hypothetical protein [Roseicyclus marinus]
MKRRSALHAAREQIVWIAALVISTAIVVQLERLELQGTNEALTSNPFDSSTPPAADLLAQIRALGDGQAAGAQTMAQDATALALVLLMADTPVDMTLRAEAEAMLLTLQDRLSGGDDDPILRSAQALLEAALDLDPGAAN